MEKEVSLAALLDKLDRTTDRDQDQASFNRPLREMPLVFVWTWFRHAVCLMATMKHNVLNSERLLVIAGLLLMWCAFVESICAQSVEPRACAHPLDFPLRAVHVGGNWGGTRQTVERWEANKNEPLIPLDFVEYLKGLHVNWVGLSVALHYEDSMDSTVERAYSKDRNVPTFSDDGLRQMIREFREHEFDVYLTLSFESHEAYVSERPAQRWQLGDAGQPETGVPPDDPMYAPPIKPEFWPWRPDHPDHTRFVQEFWSTYTEQALYYARIAQQEGVGIYSLGTETDRLFRTRSAGNYWVTDFGHELRLMTSKVREVYDGLLTYDMHYSTFMDSDESHRLVYDYFWQDLDLDLVGVSAWFPLAESSPSTVMSVDSLRQAYERIFQNHLIPLAIRNSGRPIVFLEYGTIDTVEGPANPSGFPEVAEFVFSDLNGNGVDDGHETQANVFRAFFETMDHYPGLVNGAFFWDNWVASNERWEAGYWRKEHNYDFRDQPGEEIVQEQYGRYEREGGACSEPGPEDPSDFTASALAGQRLTLVIREDGTPQDIRLIFRSGDRFEETGSDPPGTVARLGSYDYQRIGPRKGWMTLDYDDGESCVVAITFTSANAGTSSFGCSGGRSGRGSFQLKVGDIFVPVLLTSTGLNNSLFTSELTLTNRGTEEATLHYTYTARSGVGSGSATDTLAPGRQRIQPDAIDYLSGLGIPIPGSGNRIGTLRVEVSGSSRVSLTTRTTTAVPGGRAGLSYPGIAEDQGFQEAVYLCGLRENRQDRSNVAVQNMGSSNDGPITLRTTVFSGGADDSGPRVLGELELKPGEFHQYNQVLKALGNPAQGYVKVEKVEGDAPFYAYGVINDNFNSDGSFVFPVTGSSLVGTRGQTLPVIIETGSFQSELTLTNFSASEKTVDFSFVADAVDTGDDTAAFSLTLKAGEQRVLPDIVEELRRREVDGIGRAGRAFVGALFATPAEGDLSGIVIGARTGAPDKSGGQYSLFYNGVPYGGASIETAWIYGLQQNAENRSNLALVNTGEIDNSSSSFEITIYDGSGEDRPRTRNVTLGPRRWKQVNGILGRISQGYVQVRKVSGSNPFITYGVINDGGRPGERSGDGAFLLSQE